MTLRKRGRKKKRGPKKKLPEKEIKRVTWDYKVVSCNNMRQNGFIGKFASSKAAYSCVEKLLKASKEVVFPKKIVKKNGIAEDYLGEYLILERRKSDETTLLRNEFGKLVEHKTNTENWVILDKFRYNTEETFWVYGYDPKYNRKTFMWVYENIVTNIIHKYDIKRVFVYANKVIIKNDSSGMDLIICKSKSEAIRFYNMLESKTRQAGISQVFYGGAYGGSNKRTSALVKEICEYTGWDRDKVVRNGVR